MRLAPVAGSLAELATLFADIGALKRIKCAAAPYSVATMLFLRAWQRAVALEDVGAIARETAALALAASRLGAIDGATLARAGLAEATRLGILHAAFDRATAPLAQNVRAELRDALTADTDFAAAGDVPAFGLALAQQPRAGATALDAPRLVLEPPESHAEHCLAVCVYAVLIAPRYGTSGTDAFLLGLGHHLHNAALPDSGFAGEMLLGDHLATVVERFTEDALAQIPATLAARVRDVRRHLLPAANEPEARAFHAADVIDRVLQVRHYARVSAFELSHAFDDLELVHAGPLQRFHTEVLAEAGLS